MINTIWKVSILEGGLTLDSSCCIVQIGYIESHVEQDFQYNLASRAIQLISCP